MAANNKTDWFSLPFGIIYALLTNKLDNMVNSASEYGTSS